jgi:hypothetical protein
VVRQGPVSLALHLAAFVGFTVAASLVFAPAGWLVAGGCCLWLESNTRDDRP